MNVEVVIVSDGSKLISIIVPVFNTEKYLPGCIESIISQTYSNFELFLIDDGSNDNSPSICDSYALSDERITVVHQNNAGVSEARNKGLASAKGDYFCFIDSDDEIEPDMLEKLYETAEKTNSDLTICGYMYILGEKAKPFSSRYEEVIGENNIALFVADHYMEWLIHSPWGKLYRNIQFEPKSFDRNKSFGEDEKFNIGFFRSAKKIVILENCLYRYRYVEGSLFKTYKDSHFDGLCDIHETALSYLSRAGLKQATDLEKVNLKFFSLSFYLICRNIIAGNTPHKTIQFIRHVCNTDSVQNAVRNLSAGSFAKRLGISAVRRKNVFLLYLMALIKTRLMSKNR